MPDLCWNKLMITGPEDELNRFESLGRGKHSVLSLNSLYKVPKDVNRAAWCEEHWGTDRDVTKANRRLSPQDGGMIYTFLSVIKPPLGLPPLKWLLKVSKDFPDLQFDLLSIDYVVKIGFQPIIKDGKIFVRKTDRLTREFLKSLPKEYRLVTKLRESV